MSRLLAALLPALALLLPLSACGQPQPAPAATPKAPATAPADADPALWMVSDDDTTIYLFGTIHVLKPGLSWFDEAVRTAFDRSDTLVTEIVATDPAAMRTLIGQIAAAPGEPPLTSRIPAEKRAAYAQALASLGMPAATFDGMKPWFAAVTLSMAPLAKLGFDGANGPEAVLETAAAKAGKRSIGLETAAQQFGYFNSLSAGAQMQFLTSTLDELPKLGEMMDRMVHDWAAGDPDALAREMNDGLKDSPEVAKTILYDRNAAWAGWIANRMKQPGTVFVAVGAGHLAGQGSVQDGLKARGITVRRITY